MVCSFFFFFNDTATTEIYTLSLHDALPIWSKTDGEWYGRAIIGARAYCHCCSVADRKSTRLNSSHLVISYAVFCLKKKKKKIKDAIIRDVTITSTVWPDILSTLDYSQHTCA